MKFKFRNGQPLRESPPPCQAVECNGNGFDCGGEWWGELAQIAVAEKSGRADRQVLDQKSGKLSFPFRQYWATSGLAVVDDMVREQTYQHRAVKCYRSSEGRPNLGDVDQP